jgi:3-hydroxy acid dehydrogenase / malonic semialdehyde reductase
MESIKNKTVLITGASSGFGEACAKLFAEKGAKLILAARREDKLKKLAEELKRNFNAEYVIVKLDVRDNKEVQKAIEGLPAEWKEIDILINNAGLSRGLDKLHEGSIEDWEEMIDTNIKGLLYVSKAVIPLMVKRNTGHIVNIGSIAGHEVYPKGNVYCATKHAVDAITKGMRIDLNGTNIRVSTIDPGLAETEFSMVRFRGNEERAKNVYKGLEPLSPEDIADAVLFTVTRRKNTVVAEMILLPLSQATATVVNRSAH